MSSYLIAVGLMLLVIIATEWTMWHLFRRRIEGVLLPCEHDGSHNRFFTLRRLRLFAILHSTLLLALFIGSALLAW